VEMNRSTWRQHAGGQAWEETGFYLSLLAVSLAGRHGAKGSTRGRGAGAGQRMPSLEGWGMALQKAGASKVTAGWRGHRRWRAPLSPQNESVVKIQVSASR
jgi:hypothetical protein